MPDLKVQQDSATNETLASGDSLMQYNCSASHRLTGENQHVWAWRGRSRPATHDDHFGTKVP